MPDGQGRRDQAWGPAEAPWPQAAGSSCFCKLSEHCQRQHPPAPFTALRQQWVPATLDPGGRSPDLGGWICPGMSCLRTCQAPLAGFQGMHFQGYRPPIEHPGEAVRGPQQPAELPCPSELRRIFVWAPHLLISGMVQWYQTSGHVRDGVGCGMADGTQDHLQLGGPRRAGVPLGGFRGPSHHARVHVGCCHPRSQPPTEAQVPPQRLAEHSSGGSTGVPPGRELQAQGDYTLEDLYWQGHDRPSS